MLIPVLETAGITLVLGVLSLFSIWGLRSERSAPVTLEDQTRTPRHRRRSSERRSPVTRSPAGRRPRRAAARSAHHEARRAGTSTRLLVTLLAAIHARQAGNASHGRS